MSCLTGISKFIKYEITCTYLAEHLYVAMCIRYVITVM